MTIRWGSENAGGGHGLGTLENYYETPNTLRGNRGQWLLEDCRHSTQRCWKKIPKVEKGGQEGQPSDGEHLLDRGMEGIRNQCSKKRVRMGAAGWLRGQQEGPEKGT